MTRKGRLRKNNPYFCKNFLTYMDTLGFEFKDIKLDNRCQRLSLKKIRKTAEGKSKKTYFPEPDAFDTVCTWIGNHYGLLPIFGKEITPEIVRQQIETEKTLRQKIEAERKQRQRLAGGKMQCNSDICLQDIRKQMEKYEGKDYLPICILKWAVKCKLNTIISGEMGIGKTTMLRMLVQYVDNTYTISVHEKYPELNLNLVYPGKIFSNSGTETMSTVNITGEITDEEQSSCFVQSITKDSMFGLTTHSAMTTESLINSISNDLLQTGIYSDKKDAIRAVANVINLDCHMSNIKGNRRIERITEIIPSEEKGYEVIDLLEWKADDDIGPKGHYEIINLPSSDLIGKMMKQILAKDDQKQKAELEEFRQDLLRFIF